MKAVFLSLYNYEKLDAGANRNINLGACFASNGYNVIHCGSGFFCSEKILFKSIWGKNNGNRYVKTLFLDSYIKKTLLDLSLSNGDILIITYFFSPSIYRMISRLIPKEVIIIFSIVEKYTFDEFSILSPDILLYYNCKYFYKNYKKITNNFICISNFIRNLLADDVLNLLVIPFVFAKKTMPSLDFKKSNSIVKNIIYVGNPGKKDLLQNCFLALEYLTNDELEKIHYHIYGVGTDWLKKSKISISERCLKRITFYGRQPREVVVEAYGQMDYSMLLRNPDKIFAKAGFPTKISETLYYGVPPICNLSSDLSLYLSNLENSIICNGFSPLSFSESLRIAINMDHKVLHSLKVNAKNTQKMFLSADCYNIKLNNFIKRAQK